VLEFEDLPFFDRPDLTPYLVHLTKNSKRQDGYSAFDNLLHILKKGEIWGSDSAKGFIKGPNPAACFMDVPFASLKYVLNPRDSDPTNPRYEPYGIIVTKRWAYNHGCRPVLYLSNDEVDEIGVPKDELWRVVRFEVSKTTGWISWLHEREWRCKGDFKMPSKFSAVLVRTVKEAIALNETLHKTPEKFKALPGSVLPLEVICQGLIPAKPLSR